MFCFVKHSLRMASGAKRIPRAPPFEKLMFAKEKPTPLSPDNEKFLENLIAMHSSTQHQNKEISITPAQWTPQTKRCGLLAIKIGLVPQWLKNGKQIYTTVLQVLDNHVIDYTSPEKCKTNPRENIPPYFYKRYGVQVVGALSADPRLFSDNYRKLFEKLDILPKYRVTRFIVTPEAAIPVGTRLSANHFQVGHFVNAEAVTVDRGFQGVMKRWGFSGGPAGHGSTKFHRRAGAVYRGPGKMLKGTKMPGHMGNELVTMLSLRVWRIIPEHDLLFVSGPGIPGPNHSFVRLWDCRGVSTIENIIESKRYPHMPTHIPTDELDQNDFYDDSLFPFSAPSVEF